MKASGQETWKSVPVGDTKGTLYALNYKHFGAAEMSQESLSKQAQKSNVMEQ